MAMNATKEDFANWYKVAPRDPVTNRRYTKTKLSYHPAVYPLLGSTQYIPKLLSKLNLTSADRVLVVGAGFGWLCEELIKQTGCTCIGTDTSDYIEDNKTLSPNDELLESIVAGGFAVDDGGYGQEVWELFGQTKARTTATIEKEDLLTKGSENRVKNVLGGDPTHIITEEMWQLLTQPEKEDLIRAFASLGGTVTHIRNNEVT